MKYLVTSLILALAACTPATKTATEVASTPFNSSGKSVTVYTTADSTGYRLTPMDTLSFYDLGQPKETDICVFVDPSKTFQTFMGIGGALTDASAETF